MENQIQQEVRWVKRIRRIGVPVLVLYILSMIVALLFEKMLLIPLMWSVALFLIFMGHTQYRLFRHFSTHPKSLRWLQVEYADTWISAILMGTFMTTLLTTESLGFRIGFLFGIWGLTEKYRSRIIARQLKQYDPDIPTYDEVIERMS
ncbi:hypothetical protein [Exiguobacterium sp. AM39-5BH]|uniref:hypothetical protein n=1 Tax=Exiguobacterium sp. AM39-5BH TaxID=2292355 RepID=UPI000FE18B5F|nr:hypothetical protein [Exiguobacterium sp. AM39-5BH]RHB48494.1 hypothetical protein DW881_11380 [Exiguobacterium sp. AM39-5BH]